MVPKPVGCWDAEFSAPWFARLIKASSILVIRAKFTCWNWFGSLGSCPLMVDVKCSELCWCDVKTEVGEVLCRKLLANWIRAHWSCFCLFCECLPEAKWIGMNWAVDVCLCYNCLMANLSPNLAAQQNQSVCRTMCFVWVRAVLSPVSESHVCGESCGKFCIQNLRVTSLRFVHACFS